MFTNNYKRYCSAYLIWICIHWISSVHWPLKFISCCLPSLCENCDYFYEIMRFLQYFFWTNVENMIFFIKAFLMLKFGGKPICKNVILTFSSQHKIQRKMQHASDFPEHVEVHILGCLLLQDSHGCWLPSVMCPCSSNWWAAGITTCAADRWRLPCWMDA